MLRNLVSKVVKFTPAGGTITLRAEWVRAGLSSTDLTRVDPSNEFIGWKYAVTAVRPYAGVVRILVSDSGAGMSAAQRRELFGEGMQFNANTLQAGQGSGLGLFIAKEIVEQHGGRLNAASAGLEKGSTFIVVLPLFVGPKEEEEEEKKKKRMRRKRRRRRRRKERPTWLYWTQQGKVVVKQS